MLTKNIDTMKAEVARHIEADAVLAGEYWTAAVNQVGGQGCFIGCLTHGSNAADVTERFGMPEPLVCVAAHIFERLSQSSESDGVEFFRSIPEAIGSDGKDLSRVVWAFLADTLRNLPEVSADIQVVIDPVIDGMDLLSAGEEWSDAAARAAAADAARAAARAAYAAYAAYAAAADAARAAARAAADATRAAYAAADAANAAPRAAYAADAAADAGAAEVKRQRDVFLNLLRAA